MTIFDIKRFALHDGPGIRTTIFLKGCPLRCAWCHNPESHHAEPETYLENTIIDGKEVERVKRYGKRINTRDLVTEILKDKAFFQESGGGATFSGGEPLMQPEPLVRILRELKSHDVHRTVDTSGHAERSVLEEVATETDLFLFDLKAMDSHLHEKFTGVPNELILENAEFLLEKGARLIFRIPLIPGVNDHSIELEAYRQYLSSRKDRVEAIHLLPYHRTGSHKYTRIDAEQQFYNVEESDSNTIDEIKDNYTLTGIPVVVGG